MSSPFLAACSRGAPRSRVRSPAGWSARGSCRRLRSIQGRNLRSAARPLNEHLEPAHLEWIAVDSTNVEEAAVWREPALNADHPALLQYTSGTTSSPRGVMVSHANLLANAQSIAEGFRAPERSLGRHLASALPRHGSDGGDSATRVFWRPLRSDISPGFRPAASGVAGSGVAIPGSDQRWAELCL